MTTYLDVGVVRIGEYVARVPRLRSIRAASTAVSAATERVRDAAADGALAGCHPHDEAGHADGVLHLVVDDTSPDSFAKTVLGKLPLTCQAPTSRPAGPTERPTQPHEPTCSHRAA